MYIIIVIIIIIIIIIIIGIINYYYYYKYGTSKITVFVWGKYTIVKFVGNTK